MRQPVRRLIRVLLAAAISVVAWSGSAPTPAAAHQPGSTLLIVDVVGNGLDGAPVLRLTASMPVDELDTAYGLGLAEDPAAGVDRHRYRLHTLLQQQVLLTDAHGEAWPVAVQSLTAGVAHDRDIVQAVLTVTSPVAAVPGDVTLRWDVVTEVVHSHKVYVGGVDAEQQERYLGVIVHHQPTLTLAVDAPAAGAGTSLILVGFEHFREGLDHLLFLALLALGVARLGAKPGKTAWRLLGLTVTFTVAHSLSLALAAVGAVNVPTALIETAIAGTIVLAAANAVRPVLSQRAELGVTAAFGLIHGLGFAGVLNDLAIGGPDLVYPLLTFNLGLEAAQVLALLAVSAQLWFIAQSPTATRVVAGVVGLVALAWIAERAFRIANPLEPTIEVLMKTPERFALVLLIPAALVTVGRLRRPRSVEPRSVDATVN